MKKEEMLKPEIKDKTSLTYNNKEDISLDEDTQVFTNETDSYFKNVVNNLMNDTNISLKTEYLSVMENFTGAKLTFLSKFGNMPYIDDFINTFETKRVSLLRKSRIEIIRALEKREEEIRLQKANQLNNMFGL